MQVPRAAAVYLGVVQFFFALTWTVYVIFLPQLLARFGFERSDLIWILMADQVVFAMVDVAAGVAVDRVGRTLGRLGAPIAAVTVFSCIAFLLLPQLPAEGSMRAVFLGLTFLWAASSSALRAPAWVLLMKYAAAPAAPKLSALSVMGLALASILTPYLTATLRNLDPRLPFALSSVSLLVTAAGLIWVERWIAQQPPVVEPAGELGQETATQDASGANQEARALAQASTRLLTLFLSGGALLFLGYQAFSSFATAPQYLRYAPSEDLDWLFPVFWISFNIVTFPASVLATRIGPVRLMGLSAALGAIGALVATLAPDLSVTIAGQLISGAAWGGVLMAGFAAAVGFGREGREGLSLGTWFSVQAVATLARMGIVAANLNRDPDFLAAVSWVPPILWLCGAAVFALLVR
ncbi:MAG TPA: hypothetical protein VGJ87_13180, partial [Roseiflexaceae bacterium]